jgi:WD40-like Beta Propeller Repeat
VAFGENEGTPLVDIASAETKISLNEIDGMGYSFSPDNSKIAMDIVTVEDLSVEVWDIASQTILATLPKTGNVRFSPNGKFLAGTSYEDSANPLKIFTPDASAQITTLKVNGPNGLTGIEPVFSPDGLIIASQIATGSPAAPIAWDTVNWQLLEAPALQGDLYSFSPDGRILITRAFDGGILIWGILP